MGSACQRLTPGFVSGLPAWGGSGDVFLLDGVVAKGALGRREPKAGVCYLPDISRRAWGRGMSADSMVLTTVNTPYRRCIDGPTPARCIATGDGADRTAHVASPLRRCATRPRGSLRGAAPHQPGNARWDHRDRTGERRPVLEASPANLAEAAQTVEGRRQLAGRGQPVSERTFGGGSALMLALGIGRAATSTPSSTTGSTWASATPRWVLRTSEPCSASDRQSRDVKILNPDGEIDIIAAGAVTDLKPCPFRVDGRDVRLEYPVEIPLQDAAPAANPEGSRPLRYRSPRPSSSKLLDNHLQHLTPYKADLKARLDDVTVDDLSAELTEIDESSGWEHLPERAFDSVREIFDAIPEPACKNG